MATAPPFDAESALIGCVVCGYAEGTEAQLFSCGCHLPIHTPCISDWKQNGSICPFCEREWRAPPASLAHHRRDNCNTIGICAALAVLFILVAAFGVSLFLYFKHLA